MIYTAVGLKILIAIEREHNYAIHTQTYTYIYIYIFILPYQFIYESSLKKFTKKCVY